jgi:hypothetical protein
MGLIKIKFRTKEYGNLIPFLEIDAQELKPLLTDVDTLSESKGGKVEFMLRAGQENAFRNYILLGSITGTWPGTPLPSGLAVLPLNWDVFTDLVLTLLNTPLFMNFFGVLDSSGDGSALLNLPGPLPSGSQGMVIHFAYALNNPYDFTSNPAAIEIVE